VEPLRQTLLVEEKAASEVANKANKLRVQCAKEVEEAQPLLKSA